MITYRILVVGLLQEDEGQCWKWTSKHVDTSPTSQLLLPFRFFYFWRYIFSGFIDVFKQWKHFIWHFLAWRDVPLISSLASPGNFGTCGSRFFPARWNFDAVFGEKKFLHSVQFYTQGNTVCCHCENVAVLSQDLYLHLISGFVNVLRTLDFTFAYRCKLSFFLLLSHCLTDCCCLRF